MADTDNVSTHYVFESTAGVTPNNPVFRTLRTKAPQVQIDNLTTESQEISGDRQVRDIIALGQDVSGNIGLEMSYGNADDWIEAVMCGTWQIKARGAPSAVTTTQFTLASGGTAFAKGMLVRGSGFTQAANNALFKLSANATETAVAVTGAAAEASPPAGATIKAVGFECASGDCAANGAAKTLTISSTSGDWTKLGLAVGEFVMIGGSATANQFATSGCNGWARISAITATVLTFDVVPAGWATDNGSGKSIRIGFGDRLVNGTTRRRASLQRRFNDHSPVTYETSRGQEASAMAFQFRPQSIAEATLMLMGRTGGYETAQISGATDVAAPDWPIMATDDDIGMLIMDGSAIAASDEAFLQNFSIQIDNRLRKRAALGKRGTAAYGAGKFRVTGQADFYFERASQLTKVLSNEDVSVAGAIGDGTRTMLWSLPAIRLAGSPSVPGQEQDVMLPLRYAARKHPTLGYTLMFQRFDEKV